MFAILFPGQGAQHVGMGANLFAASPDRLGQRANDVLGWDLRALCMEGPLEALTETHHAQPALYALSVALWELVAAELDSAGLAASAMAGHSLGEYSALAASGALGFEDGLRLVQARGEAMARAAGEASSSMAALLGATLEDAEQLCAARRGDGGRLWVANINAPGQVVIAGGAEDLEWAATAARDHGIRRVVPLVVAGAFHTPFMAAAQPALRTALERASFTQPRPPVWSNVTAGPVDAEHIEQNLGEQITAPVRFQETLEGIAAEQVHTFVHVGPGDVTAGLAKRTVPGCTTIVINSLDGIEAALGELKALGSMQPREEA